MKSQVAALPVRLNKRNRVEVLLVTSRGSGRWLPPKGSEMDGKSRRKAAEIEAREEAGVCGCMADRPIGRYAFAGKAAYRVILYPMFVETVLKRWKEGGERKRRWFTLKKAARVVHERELQRIILSLQSEPTVRRLLRAHG
ncbi:NUDIX domain-containing protein [Sedimentitalea sp.]